MGPGSFPLDATFELDLEISPEDSPSGIAAHTPPGHHRTPSLVDTPGSGNSSTSGATGSLNTSLNGSSNSSSSGGGGSTPVPTTPAGSDAAKLSAPAFSGMSLELPDFACMLPSECCFSESFVADAAAPTPHTPVVLSVFEGEGLKLVSAQAGSHGSSSSSSSSRHSFDDEFEADLMDGLPLGGSSGSSSSSSSSGSSSGHGVRHHGVHHLLEQYASQEEALLAPQFTSLLARRTLSAVLEVENEGTDEEQQQQQQQCGPQQQQQPHRNAEQQQQQQEQDQQQVLLQCLEPTWRVEQQQQQQQQQSVLAAAAAGEAVVVEHDVELVVSSDNPQQQQQQQCTVNSIEQPKQVGQQQQQQQSSDSRQQQQQQQQIQHSQLTSEPPDPAAAATASIDSADSLELTAVELKITSRSTHSGDGGKAAAAVAAGSTAAAAATATAATGSSAVVVEDVWDLANKERLRELQQAAAQQPTSSAMQQQQQFLSYAAAEAQLLSTTDLGSHRVAVLRSLPQQHSSWLARQLQRLLACGSCSTGCSCSCSTGGGSGGGGSSSGGVAEEVVLLLSLAKAGLSESNAIHGEMLQAVYTTFTGKGERVPRFGGHWCDVGFQGDDPATDLRGVGMLGLLQLMYLPQHNAAAARKLYQLSISPQQEFPLAVVSLNISHWMLNALRSGCLRRAAAQQGGYVAAANSFYCGAFYEFYARWCQGKTMREAGHVLKQLEDFCRRHPAQLMKLAASPDKAMAAADKRAWQP